MKKGHCAWPLAALWGLLACEGPSPPETRCTVVPELVAERRACRSDEDCPCGAGCELGVCVASCESDEQCGGGWCDDFGRCRSAEDRSLLPGLRTVSTGLLRPSTALLRLTALETARPFEVVVEGGLDVPRLRAEADPGLEVRCGDEGAFGSECTREDVAAGSRIRFWVRGTRDFDAARRHDVRLFTDRGVETIGVTTGPIGETPPPVREVPAAGLYEGSAVLGALGVGTDVSSDVAGSMALPLAARAYLDGSGHGVLVIDDASGVLASGGTWIGRFVSGAGGRVELDLPAIRYLQGDAWAGVPLDVVASPDRAPVLVRGDALSVDLVVRFQGMLPAGRSPTARWQLALVRTGDLPSGATPPPVPDAVSPVDATALALRPLPWEGEARAALGDENVFAADDARRRELLATFARTARGQPGTLGACALDAADLDVLGGFALREAWGLTSDPEAAPLLAPTVQERLRGAFASAAPTALTLDVTPTSSVRPRTIPCAAFFAALDAPSSCAPGTRYRLGMLDICDRMAEAYGCDVEEAAPGTTLDLSVSGSVEVGACRESLSPVTLSGAVTRTCRLPVVPEGCGELAVCYEPPADDAPDASLPSSLVSTRLEDGPVLGVSGDLVCPGGTRTFFALDLNQEQTPCPPSEPACRRLGASQIVEACLADLARVRDAAPRASSSVAGARLRELFAAAPACADFARLVFAAGLATEPDRRRALDRGGPASPVASRTAHRLLQRLVQQLAFIAGEAARRERIAEMYREAPGGPDWTTAEALLGALVPAWDLLLHPRIAIALDAMSADVLAAPDYRDATLGRPVGEGQDELATGLPVALLELANAQLELLERRTEWAALDADASVLSTVATHLRYGTLVRALADAMVERARASAGSSSVPWISRYGAAARQLQARWARLLQRTAAIALGRNPLGIEEEDLPLYFLGDEATPTTRFSAISDFLIGSMPGSVISGSAWAPALVQLARDAWDDGLPFYIEQLDRQVQVRMSEAELAAELESIRLEYGARLANICYPDDLATRDLLEMWAFDEDTCFYRSTAPECVLDPSSIATLMTVDRVALQMCIVGEMRRAVGPFVTLGSDVADRLADDFSQCGEPRYPERCPDGIDAPACLGCDLDGERVYVPLTADHFREAPRRAMLPARIAIDAQNVCLERFPGVDPTLPGPDDLPDSPVARRDCYNGSLGEAIFELRAAEQDVTIARREFEQSRARYDIAVRSCATQHLGAEMQAQLLRQHDETMRALEDTKLGLDVAAELTDAASDCLGSFAEVDVGDVIRSAGAAIGLTAAACATRMTAAGLRSGAAAVERDMARAERSHEMAMQMVEAETEMAVCMNDASMELVDERAAAERVAAALLQVDAAAYRIEELKIAARTIYEDGRAALQAARDRYVRPLTHDFWLDAQVDRFWRDMQLARRVTYLAVRAVEYELQQSLPQRATVLRARLPDQLWAVLSDLWTMTGTRSIRGNRPTDLKVVLSLRDSLLQVADRSGFGDGEHRLTDVERFRLLLTSPEYAVFGDDGTYRGQRIPFVLAPLGSIGIGDPQAIPVLAGSDCAERLWSVNASILGEDLYRGDTPTFVRIDLLKSNTFASQWCTPPGPEQPPLQTASVRPSRNLFRDPELGTTMSVGGPLGLTNEQTLESRARIEAYFNVDRTTFENDAYANGSTSELAARGLYGQYALFIPAEVIARDGRGGLVLEHIDDILIRLDYVSVAR